MPRISAVFGCWSIRKNLHDLLHRDEKDFPIINGLRFWGFFWVLVIHTAMPYAGMIDKQLFVELLDSAPFYLWWIWNADKAVDLFFVLSGFLIGLILLRELQQKDRIQLSRFYSRRYLRLTPVYALVIVIYWAGEGPNYEFAWTNLLYINNFLPSDKMPMYWTWTLAVEEQFYLILPVLLLIIHRFWSRYFLRAMLFMLVLSVLIRALAFYYFEELWTGNYQDMIVDLETSIIFYSHIYDNLITRFGPFVLGILAAHGYLYHSQAIIQWAQEKPHLLIALNVVVMATLIFFMHFPFMATGFSEPSWGQRFYLIFNRTLFSAAFTWFVLAACLQISCCRWLAKFYSLRVWHPLGQLTYSMYIIHCFFSVPTVRHFTRLYRKDNLPMMEYFMQTVSISVVCALVITVVSSLLLWLMVEKPFLNLRELFAVNQGAASAAMKSVPTRPNNEHGRHSRVTLN